MPTIAELMNRRNVLLPETQALSLLSLSATQEARQWLRARLPHRFANLPRETVLYATGDLDKLRNELRELSKLTPPPNSRP